MYQSQRMFNIIFEYEAAAFIAALALKRCPCGWIRDFSCWFNYYYIILHKHTCFNIIYKWDKYVYESFPFWSKLNIISRISSKSITMVQTITTIHFLIYSIGQDQMLYKYASLPSGYTYRWCTKDVESNSRWVASLLLLILMLIMMMMI